MAQLNPLATTANDICVAALRECGFIGVGQTPLADDLSDAQSRLQWMLQQWERQRWLVWHLVTYGLTSNGSQSYTVGPGGQINTSVVPAYNLSALSQVALGLGYHVGDRLTLVGFPATTPQATLPIIQVSSVGAGGTITSFFFVNPGLLPAPFPSTFTQQSTTGTGAGATFNNPVYALSASGGVNQAVLLGSSAITARPAKIESCFLRQLINSQPNQVDYAMDLLQSMEDYNRITLKQLMAFPGWAFYDSAWPLGNLYTWPVPQPNIYAVFISVMEQLPAAFATAGAVISIPFEYYAAMLYNLALRLRVRYSIPAFPGDMLPGLAKDSLAVLRGANTQIARLQMPTELKRDGLYNVYSDQSY